MVVLTMFDDNIVLFATLVIGAATLGIFVLWGPDLFLPRRKRGQVVGLVNLGHTCFLNTLLQALASCPQYIDWLQHNNKSGNLTTSLHHVLQIVNGSDKDAEDPFTPSHLIRVLSKHGWVISSGQQDAHELFQVIMETLEEEMQEGSTESKTTFCSVNHGCPKISGSQRSSDIRNVMLISSFCMVRGKAIWPWMARIFGQISFYRYGSSDQFFQLLWVWDSKKRWGGMVVEEVDCWHGGHWKKRPLRSLSSSFQPSHW
uniref:ubiquitinyl hydrolase 1 n=1 Tax=Timema shepardi TaxID=629360 RepID=A0A7R9G596_TIMSH|nr:unnamed protein product [Timema shepardi]